MRLQKWIPAILAVLLIIISGTENANAYFTTYVIAKGGYSWRHEEAMNESFNDWNKYITVTSKEGSVPVYVRVKAFTGSKYTLTYAGDDWTYNAEDNYYYYNRELNGGETTSALRVFIANMTSAPENEDNFNVVVVYETIPVQYDEAGNLIEPAKADWSEGKNNE